MPKSIRNMPIADDPALLRLMIADAESQPDIYQPGPHWRRKTKNALNQIRRSGLADFRGCSSTIGLSFTDSVYVDVRHDLSSGIRKPFKFLFESVFPFKDIFSAQVSLTKSCEGEARRLKNILLGSDNPRVRELLGRYTMPPSLAGGCMDYVEIDGNRISTHYLNLLHQLDRLGQKCGFSGATSLFEIGGGFGSNVHILLENYPRLKKVVYLDIPPNLYVGTQYLKSIYGDSVLDYRQTRHLDVIQFAEHDRIEILAIAPWQIERLNVSVDVVYNAHSFVEMPQSVVSNYAGWLAKLPGFESTTVAMITYDNFDLRTTFDPEMLVEFFPTKRFDRSTFQVLDRRYGVIAFISRK